MKVTIKKLEGRLLKNMSQNSENGITKRPATEDVLDQLMEISQEKQDGTNEWEKVTNKRRR